MDKFNTFRIEVACEQEGEIGFGEGHIVDFISVAFYILSWVVSEWILTFFSVFFIFHKQSSPMLSSRRRNLQPTTRLSLSPYAIRKTVLYVLPPPQNGNSNVHSAFVSVR